MAEAKKRIVLGSLKNPVRFSFAHVFEPHKGEGMTVAKFSVSVLIPKSDTKTYELVKAEIEKQIEIGSVKDGIFKNKKIRMSNWKEALRDGDETDKPEYQGHWFVNMSSDKKPEVVDVNTQAIYSSDPGKADAFYSGCWGVVSGNFYAYNNVGMGVGAGLGNLMKVRDGEPFGSQTTAADDFAGLELDTDLNEEAENEEVLDLL